MLKIFGAFCFVIAGAFYGASESEKLKNRFALCSRIRDFLTQIHIKIRCCGTDVFELVREFKASEAFSELNFIMNLPSEFVPGTDFHELWRSAIEKDSSLGSDEKKLLFSFGESLGTSDIAGQLMTIEEALETLHDIEDKRFAEYNRKGRLYRSLGTLAGVMVGILLI